MQKALVAASRTSLLGHFGGRYGGAAVVSVKLQDGPGSRVVWKGDMVTKAGEQVEQAGEDPKVEVSSSDEENDKMHPHTRKAYRDDMEESYGVGYATRASEMGYGERYGEAVKAVLDKSADKETQRGATSDRDQHADAFIDAEYDTTQGEPVAEKEIGRHSPQSHAFESKRTVHVEEEVIHEEKIIHKEKIVSE